jgi:hypothetical protein
VTLAVVLGLILALGSSAAINWGYLAQHGAASTLPPLTLRRPVRSLVSLFSNLRWLAGFLAGIGGWVLYVAALALAPLSLVQAAAAGGIGLLALLVDRGPGRRLERREWRAVWISIAGLLLLGLSLVGGSEAGRVGGRQDIVLWMGASLVVAAVAAGPGSKLLARGAGLGIAAGVLYAAGDVGTKAVVHGHGYLVFVPVVLACHGLAFVALQLGFQRGGALATAGVATLLTNALPIGAGIVLFHEALPAGLFGVVRVAAFACVVAGAALLARPDGEGGAGGQEAMIAEAENLSPVRVTASGSPKQSLMRPAVSVSATGPDATA